PLGVTNLLDAQLLLSLGAAELLALRLPAASAEHPPGDDDGREEDAEEQIRGRGERVALRVDGVLGRQQGEPKEHDQDCRLPPTVRGDGVEEEDPGRPAEEESRPSGSIASASATG